MNVKRLWGGVNNIQGTLDASNLISADSVVKSVQRGLANVTESGINVTTSDLTISIPISTVNPSKCLLFHDIGLDWGIETGSSGNPAFSNIVVAVTQNSININFRMTISGNGTCRITAYGEWQVIEFY